MSSHRTGRPGPALTLLLAVLLAGCAPDPDPWNESDQERLDALAGDPWVDGTRVETPPSEAGLWRRPEAERRTPVDGAPGWQVAAAEVAEAQSAGWSVAFVRCVGPDGPHVVDLWRELADGAPATARITVGLEDVVVTAVAPQHLDGDVVVTPATVEPEVCLAAPTEPLVTRWSGRPVMLRTSGGPASAAG